MQVWIEYTGTSTLFEIEAVGNTATYNNISRQHNILPKKSTVHKICSLRLRFEPHRFAAFSKLNSSLAFPSIVILIKLSKVCVFNEFQRSVLIQLMAEKPF